MERYEIKRVVGDVVLVINRVASIEDIIIGINDFIYDTEFECGVVL